MSEVETQKQEYFKKYEQYKAYFFKEKSEKEARINELKILREGLKDVDPAVNQLVRAENYKSLHAQEV